MTEPVWLRKSAILAIHNLLVARFGGLAGVRDEDLLDSALTRASNLYRYEANSQLPTLAASYAAGIIQNHPFVDGNKRTGFMAAYVFLQRNGLVLSADEATATTMTMALAASEIEESTYATWLAQHIAP